MNFARVCTRAHVLRGVCTRIKRKASYRRMPPIPPFLPEFMRAAPYARRGPLSLGDSRQTRRELRCLWRIWPVECIFFYSRPQGMDFRRLYSLGSIDLINRGQMNEGFMTIVIFDEDLVILMWMLRRLAFFNILENSWVTSNMIINYYIIRNKIQNWLRIFDREQYWRMAGQNYSGKHFCVQSCSGGAPEQKSPSCQPVSWDDIVWIKIVK